jgi:hypothetical protein
MPRREDAKKRSHAKTGNKKGLMPRREDAKKDLTPRRQDAKVGR